MYNLIKYNSNYFETTGSLRFDADIENTNNFESFKYKVKLLWKTVADGANRILKNKTTAVPLKYLSKILEIT